jgi:hypothetical protein
LDCWDLLTSMTEQNSPVISEIFPNFCQHVLSKFFFIL